MRSKGGRQSVGRRLFEAARVLERIGAESRMDAAEAAWRQLSVEATNVLQILHGRIAPAEEPCPS